MSQRKIIEDRKIISYFRNLIDSLDGKERKVETIYEGIPCLVIDERNRAAANTEINWMALQLPRPLNMGSDVNLVRTENGFAVFPAVSWQDTVENALNDYGSASILIDVYDETQERENRIRNAVHESERAIGSRAYSSIDWQELFLARAHFKAAEVDRFIPYGFINDILDSVEWPLKGLRRNEAYQILSFPGTSEPELTNMLNDRTLAGATLARYPELAESIMPWVVLYQKRVVDSCSQSFIAEADELVSEFRSKYGNNSRAITEIESGRYLSFEKRCQRQLIINSISSVTISRWSEEDTRILLDFMGIASDFNEKNNYWNRRFLGCINRVAKHFSMDASKMHMDDLVRVCDDGQGGS